MHLTNEFILLSFVAPVGAILNLMIGQIGVRPATSVTRKLVSFCPSSLYSLKSLLALSCASVTCSLLMLLSKIEQLDVWLLLADVDCRIDRRADGAGGCCLRHDGIGGLAVAAALLFVGWQSTPVGELGGDPCLGGRICWGGGSRSHGLLRRRCRWAFGLPPPSSRARGAQVRCRSTRRAG